jgi:uncharacterized protein YecE (DUF72 family)
MADQSGSAPFQALSFESALQAYEKRAGIILAQHPITMDLQSCHSLEDITALLQGRAQAVRDFRERDRMMKAIKITVTLLTPLFSDATSLTDAVRQKALMAFDSSDFFFQTSFPPAMAIQAALGILLDVCADRHL